MIIIVYCPGLTGPKGAEMVPKWTLGGIVGERVLFRGQLRHRFQHGDFSIFNLFHEGIDVLQVLEIG